MRRHTFSLLHTFIWELLAGGFILFLTNRFYRELFPWLFAFLYLIQLFVVTGMFCKTIDEVRSYHFQILKEEEECQRCKGVLLTNCVICSERPIEMIYPKCGHYCICTRCSGIQGTKCPLCRKESVPIKVFQ